MSTRFKVRAFTKLHESWREAPQQFLIQGHAEIVRDGEPGGEAIAVTIMSPAQLHEELRSSPGAVELGRGCLFLLDYDEAVVLSTLQKLVDAANAADYRQLEAAVTKYFDWVR